MTHSKKHIFERLETIAEKLEESQGTDDEEAKKEALDGIEDMAKGTMKTLQEQSSEKSFGMEKSEFEILKKRILAALGRVLAQEFEV